MADWYKATSGGCDEDQKRACSEADGSYAFNSRRSPFLCRHACVATSQPLASSIGLDMLRKGATAAETAVAVAAAMAVTEPCSTGLGGDMFCLYYDSRTRKVSCINGSGKSPAKLTREMLVEKYPGSSKAQGGIDEERFRLSPHAITVPGAAQGWQDLYDKYGSGRFSFADLLEPAAVLAEEGFPVAPVTAHHWKSGMDCIRQWHKDADDSQDKQTPLTVDGCNAPRAGEIMRNPDMARVLRELGKKGAQEAFYRGAIGKAVVDTIQKHGGCMTLDDCHAHTTSTFPEAISVDFRGIKLWQVPPNGQGVAGLIALSGLQHLEDENIISRVTDQVALKGAQSLHAQIEMMRLGFADARAHVSDAATMHVTNEWLLDKQRIGERAQQLFCPSRAQVHGMPLASSCTISFQVVDAKGNAISFVNSNFMGFGTGMVPRGCGFTLQNRGFGFTLNDDGTGDPLKHTNRIGPSKQPYHTIIPGMLTHADTGELYATLSNMGGNMQPQGHVQLTLDMVAAGLDPQAAIDRPRFCIADGTQHGMVFLEDGISNDTLHQLQTMGHNVKGSTIKGNARSVFGRAQIIKRDRNTGVLWAGSDGRADGCAMGF